MSEKNHEQSGGEEPDVVEYIVTDKSPRGASFSLSGEKIDSLKKNSENWREFIGVKFYNGSLYVSDDKAGVIYKIDYMGN